MKKNDKLRNLVNMLTMGNQREFALKCGLQPASLCRLLNGTYAMTEKYVRKICGGYPEINPDYLLGNSDEPMMSDAPRCKTKDDEIARLRQENETLRWVIQQLGIQQIDKR